MCLEVVVFYYQTSRSSARLRLTFDFNKKKLVFSFPQNQNTDGSYSPVYSYHMKKTNHDRYLQWESVQGLILSYGLRIWNPSLRRVLTLPRPVEHIPTSLNYIRKSYLGYDPLEGKHKVLSLYYYGNNFVKPLILTLGAQESWRRVTKGIPMHSPTVGGLRGCFNGVLYFEAKVDSENIIMRFDVKFESFGTIKYPECSPYRWMHNIIPYEGSLALFAHEFPFRTGELYILKDADGHKWTRQCLPGVRFKRGWNMHFKGITDAGELVFAPGSFVDSFYIQYFDPRRNSTREAFFKGFMDDEFRRSDAGVPNYGTCINVFPNHIESLVSL